ncbi:flavin mononucleotide hydrolase 1, chloroplatic isoform X2 [Ziziphus jujuba]|nr:flavin mononucleotide hydrolase 1, chloroplatic isoform X2 [Ziziphus jujuba]
MAVLLRLTCVCYPLRSSMQSAARMAMNPRSNKSSGSISCLSTSTSAGTTQASTQIDNRKLPVLLFDIMSTVVRDPFYEDVPAFFGMSMEELIECKDPNAWIEFEKGWINENVEHSISFCTLAFGVSMKLRSNNSIDLPGLFSVELGRKFFKDGRPFDLEGLKNCMRSGYSYLEGVEELLYGLRQNNYEMHAFTNYPNWYQMIEDKLKISRYLSWTFCSCKNGKRKPDHGFYLDALQHLKVDPSNCIFIDDSKTNVNAAIALGIIGLHFKDAKTLLEDLSLMGIQISTDEEGKEICYTSYDAVGW